MNKNILLKLILIVLLLSNFVVMCSIKSPFANNSTSGITDHFGVFKINQVRVNSGHEFELVLKDGRKIWAFLEVTSSYKAKDELIKLFNSSTNPRCVLKSKKESFWIVDIHITDDTGKDISIVTFLRDKGLIFKV